MRSAAAALVVIAWVSVVASSAAPTSSDLAQRAELKRTDLSGAPDMEVITSVSEFKPGEGIARHSHHGIETGYVLQGAMVQMPGAPPTQLATGTAILNLRDVPHAGFKVVGERPLRLLTVHVVDKNKPLYVWVD